MPRAKLTTKREKGLRSLVILAIWAIWKERNARIFEGKESTMDRIISSIKDEAGLWCAAGAKCLAAAVVTSVNIKKRIVLDGPRSCGKSIALAMLLHWARTEGWLVFYVPQGKDWTMEDSSIETHDFF